MSGTCTERISFTGSKGYKLDARLELPSDKPRAFALFAHCFTCSKDFLATRRISQALALREIATLRFDFTGLGNSEGDFAETNFSTDVKDILAAADFMRQKYQAPDLLIGHSLGGSAMLAAAKNITEAVAVATIGSPSDPSHVSKHFADVMHEIEECGEAVVEFAGRPFRIQKQFVEDISEKDLTQAVRQLNKALIIFHSPIDKVVDIKHARQVFEMARHPKSFVSLDDMDHMLSQKEDADYVAGILSCKIKA